MTQEKESRRGNPAFVKGGPSPNPAGRPKGVNLPARTNRELREQSFMELLRKFKPHQSKAIMAAVKILDNEESADANKLKSAALLIGTYRDLLKDAYDYRYDTDEGQAIQETTPLFSLKVIDTEEKSGT